MQIFVLGMHRSGTSTISRILNLMGCYFGESEDEIPGSSFNNKGYWERKDVLDINEKILAEQNSSWCDVANLADRKSNHETQQENRIKNVIKKLDRHRPWFIKDPRLCLTLHSWLKFTECPLVIRIIRNPNDVADSLYRRNNFDEDFSKALWEFYNKSLVNLSSNLEFISIDYNELIENPVHTVNGIYSKLRCLGVTGLRLPSDKEILGFIDPTLRHSNDERSLNSLEKHVIESTLNADAMPSLSEKSILEIKNYSKKEKIKMQLSEENSALKSKIDEKDNKITELKAEIYKISEKNKEQEKDISFSQSSIDSLSKSLESRNIEISRLLKILFDEQKKTEELTNKLRQNKPEKSRVKLKIPPSKYLRAGKIQRAWRNINPKSTFNKELSLIMSSELFDSEYYQNKIKNVNFKSKKQAAKHFLVFGGHQFIQPSSDFKIHKYISENYNLCLTGTNPLIICIKNQKK